MRAAALSTIDAAFWFLILKRLRTLYFDFHFANQIQGINCFWFR